MADKHLTDEELNQLLAIGREFMTPEELDITPEEVKEIVKGLMTEKGRTRTKAPLIPPAILPHQKTG